MALNVGSRLAHYDVTALIGEGGMGQVYQATDTKLNRQVALKILPEAFATDPDRLARFQREAQVLASLNHPNIAQIHGIEEADDTRALVLELVEGPTLAERISRGPIPIDEALPIAKQIAEALEAAHEAGVIHRDLKPANIKVREDGTVKVLDFGLAKALDPSPTGDPSQSPTLTAAATQMGVIMGTAAYMSPEQARGKTVDRRADIWAFGAVLFEMLTGRRAFEGEDVSVTLANVINQAPEWERLPDGIRPSLRTYLQRCLEKEPARRVQAIGDMRLAMEGAFETSPSPTAGAVGVSHAVWRRPVPLALAASLLTAVVIGLAIWGVGPESQPAAPGARFVLSASPSAPLAVGGLGRDLAISPDGARVVYTSGSPAQLYVRAIDQLEGTVLPGTEGATHPFFSPDGDWIAFATPNIVRKVSLLGGLAVTLSSSPNDFRGGSWGSDDTIVFATTAGVFRVPAAGGEATPLLLADDETGRTHFWPEVLPGGRAVLFTNASGDLEGRAIFLLNLETLEERSLIPGVAARYSPTGHIVYAAAGTLLAVPFDLDRLEVTGNPVPVVEGVMIKATGAADFDLAADGSLVYVGGSADGGQEVVWVDRDGRETPMPGLPRNAYRDVRVSPDGTRVAIATQDDVWTYDVGRATLSRLTTHPANDRSPQWSPDGARIVFTSNRGGRTELFWKQADGTGDDEPLLARAETLIDLRAHDWSPDGRHLMFGEVTPQIACSFGQAPIADGSELTVLLQDAFCNDYAAVSPDGRWIAYDSTFSGQPEIYVGRYPNLSDRQQISSAGGRLPLWSADGSKLFFSGLDDQQMLAVPIQSGDSLVAGRPEVLFEKVHPEIEIGWRPYDVSPDGRFAMITSGDTGSDTDAAPNVILIQNWFQELTERVPIP